MSWFAGCNIEPNPSPTSPGVNLGGSGTGSGTGSWTGTGTGGTTGFDAGTTPFYDVWAGVADASGGTTGSDSVASHDMTAPADVTRPHDARPDQTQLEDGTADAPEMSWGDPEVSPGDDSGGSGSLD